MIQNTCNRVIWLEHGVVKQFGAPEAVVQAYEAYVKGGGERVLPARLRLVSVAKSKIARRNRGFMHNFAADFR
jgi:ABC-type glutathione transport system ATPase component